MNEPTPLVIANLKANKTWEEMSLWSDTVGKSESAKNFAGTIVVCPSAPFLKSLQQKLGSDQLPFKLGSQDISKFDQGAFTGEVAASQLQKICQFTIIGHSERRQNFKEDDSTLTEKVTRTSEANLEPIYCVQGADTFIPAGVSMVAYEPVFAIGTGTPDTPTNAFAVAGEIKKIGDYIVIYGGSVTAGNVHSFLQKGTIDGVLVGTASLDPEGFIKVIENAIY